MTEENIPTAEQIRDFVIAGHGNLPRVRELMMENPGLLNVRYQWGDNDFRDRHTGCRTIGKHSRSRIFIGPGCTARDLHCSHAWPDERCQNDARKRSEPDQGPRRGMGSH